MPRLTVDGAEAKLLLAELIYFVRTIGSGEVQRIIGMPLDRTFPFWEVLQYPGRQFNLRVAPSPLFERALRTLWAHAGKERSLEPV